MKKHTRAFAAVFCCLVFAVALSGCAALGGPTDQSSGIVQKLDALFGVVSKTQGQVEKLPTTPAADAGSSVPVYGGLIGTVLSGIAYAWYATRKISSSVPKETHDAAVAQLGNSVPMDAHTAALDAMASQPSPSGGEKA